MKINPDFKPTEQTYNNLRKHGALPEFVDYELDNFLAYWIETGKSKKSWQLTCQTWMRRAWKGKAGREWEETMRYAKIHPKVSAIIGNAFKAPKYRSERDDDIQSKLNLDNAKPIPHTPPPEAKILSRAKRNEQADKFLSQLNIGE